MLNKYKYGITKKGLLNKIHCVSKLIWTIRINGNIHMCTVWIKLGGLSSIHKLTNNYYMKCMKQACNILIICPV